MKSRIKAKQVESAISSLSENPTLDEVSEAAKINNININLYHIIRVAGLKHLLPEKERFYLGRV